MPTPEAALHPTTGDNMNKFASSLLAATVLATASPFAVSADQPVIGLITKTDTNPFFVKMKEGASQMAKERGAKLVTAAGKQDGDNAAQVTAIENMMTAGAKTILNITGSEHAAESKDPHEKIVPVAGKGSEDAKAALRKKLGLDK
jgi:ABC-type sugar transport system substrate-binding protein